MCDPLPCPSGARMLADSGDPRPYGPVAALLPKSPRETFPVNDASTHQPLTVSVSGRPLFLHPTPQPSTWYARVPGLTLSVGLHVTCLLGAIASTHFVPDRTPRPKTSLTFAPVSLAAPVDAVRLPPRPPQVAIRKIEPLPKPTRAPAPPDDASRKIEPPAAVTPAP